MSKKPCVGAFCGATILALAEPARAAAFTEPAVDEIGVGFHRVALLGSVESPTKPELTLHYRHYLEKPSLRLGLALGWQTDSGYSGLPLELCADAAFVFRGSGGWNPSVGLEAGWTGFNRLEPTAQSWPSSVIALHQSRVAHYFIGGFVSMLHFHHRRVTVSSLALHLSELGLGAHWLRLKLDLIQIGVTW